MEVLRLDRWLILDERLRHPPTASTCTPFQWVPKRFKRRLYRTCDWLTECLIYFAVLFGPWAFGTTQPWSIHVMNGVGFALGLLWLGKLFIRPGGYPPLRWTQFSGGGESGRWLRAERRFTWLLAAGTCYILLLLPPQRMERAGHLSSRRMEL